MVFCFVGSVWAYDLHTSQRHRCSGTQKEVCSFPFFLCPLSFIFFFSGMDGSIGSWPLALVWWRNEEKLDGREEVVEEVNT